MSSHLWKVTAKKAVGKVAKGMEVEVVKSGTTAKPVIKEIEEAFKRKYGISLISGCSLASFNTNNIFGEDSNHFFSSTMPSVTKCEFSKNIV